MRARGGRRGASTRAPSASIARAASASRGSLGLPSGSGSEDEVQHRELPSPTAWLAMMSATGIAASSARARQSAPRRRSGASIGVGSPPARRDGRAGVAGSVARAGARPMVSRGCSPVVSFAGQSSRDGGQPGPVALHARHTLGDIEHDCQELRCAGSVLSTASSVSTEVGRTVDGGRFPCPPSSRPGPGSTHPDTGSSDEAGDHIATHEVRINDRIRAREVLLDRCRRRAARGASPSRGAGHRPGAGARPRRGRGQRRSAGLPDHGPRQVQVRAGSAAQGSRSARRRTSSSRR